MSEMNKIYLVKRLFYYVLCYYTGMLNLQSAFDEAKQIYHEWKLEKSPQI
jgi:hypothetical protein